MIRLASLFSSTVLFIALAGCHGPEHGGGAEVAQSAQCSMCNDTYEWVYSPKGLRLGQKLVKHNCPMCKKEWTAGIASSSTCAMCAKTELACPVCQKASGK